MCLELKVMASNCLFCANNSKYLTAIMNDKERQNKEIIHIMHVVNWGMFGLFPVEDFNTHLAFFLIKLKKTAQIHKQITAFSQLNPQIFSCVTTF